jgi:signal transduction histidine kinase
MGEMLGAISHQWRQPLNVLAGHIQFLDDDYYEGLVDEKYIDSFIKKNYELIEFMWIYTVKTWTF